MGTLFGREPAMIVALVNAGLVLAVTFGLNLTEEQMAAILAFAALALGVIVRQSVYAPASVQKIANEAAAGGGTDIGGPPKGDLPR